jgi:hypothetical protein
MKEENFRVAVFRKEVVDQGRGEMSEDPIQY